MDITHKAIYTGLFMYIFIFKLQFKNNSLQCKTVLLGDLIDVGLGLSMYNSSVF
jgi:hypothetical protein